MAIQPVRSKMEDRCVRLEIWLSFFMHVSDLKLLLTAITKKKNTQSNKVVIVYIDKYNAVE